LGRLDRDVSQAPLHSALAFPFAFGGAPEYRSRRTRASWVQRDRLDLRPCGLVHAVSSSGDVRAAHILLSCSSPSRSDSVRRNPHSARAEHASIQLSAHPQGRPARKRAWSPHPRRLRRIVPPFPACAVQAGTLRLRVPPTHSNPRSRGLLSCLAAASPTDRLCLTRLVSRRGSADRVSGRFVHGYPPFRGFSPPVAARSSRTELSPMPFPTFRCRGSEDFSFRWMRSPGPVLFTPTMGRSSPGRSPLRG